MDKYIFNSCKRLLSIPKSNHIFLLNHLRKCISVILHFTNKINFLLVALILEIGTTHDTFHK